MADVEPSPWIQFACWFGITLIVTGCAIGLVAVYLNWRMP